MTAKISHKLDPARYESQTFKNLGGDLVSKREVSDVALLLSHGEESNILELGMGTGRILRNIPTRANVVGLDIDREMVKQFRRLQRTHLAAPALIHLVVADAHSLPFREGCFGAVVCIRVLKYVKQPARAISEMCAVLKPEGRLILEFSNIFSPSSLFYLAQNIPQRARKLKPFLPMTISRDLSLSGMKIVEMSGWHKMAPGFTTRLNNHLLLKIVSLLENVLQKNTPPAFLSRSILVQAVKVPPFESTTRDVEKYHSRNIPG